MSIAAASVLGVIAGCSSSSAPAPAADCGTVTAQANKVINEANQETIAINTGAVSNGGAIGSLGQVINLLNRAESLVRTYHADHCTGSLASYHGTNQQ